ncbi:MAG TPA: hypothetical protein VMU65_10345 [Candidatus Saccharimonadales bacterium]|nr:hypothetical protein [Candidatus Saccharimonadales bacterium]
MIVPNFRHAVYVLSAVAVLSVAACGSTSPTGSNGTNNNATPSTTGSAGAGTHHTIDVCTTLPAASAAQLSGQPITTADVIADPSSDGYGCAYGNTDDSIQVEVKIFTHDTASSYALFLSGSKNATPMSGLGDKAFFDNDGTMYVLAGDNLIQVNGLSTADSCAALARPVVAAL